LGKEKEEKKQQGKRLPDVLILQKEKRTAKTADVGDRQLKKNLEIKEGRAAGKIISTLMARSIRGRGSSAKERGRRSVKTVLRGGDDFPQKKMEKGKNPNGDPNASPALS